jgi:hypothetical protein
MIDPARIAKVSGRFYFDLCSPAETSGADAIRCGIPSTCRSNAAFVLCALKRVEAEKNSACGCQVRSP